MRGWSVSLARSGVAKIRAAVGGDADSIRWRWDSDGYSIPYYKPLPSRLQKQIAISSYSADIHYVHGITARPGLLSVTESVRSRLNQMGGQMSKLPSWWLARPVLMPIFLVLLVAAAMIIQW
jgi:hypothetical protein